MRHILRALVGVILMGSSYCDAAVAETGSRWWPFGRSDAPASQPQDGADGFESSSPRGDGQQTPPSQYPADGEPEQRWMINSPLAKVSWPRLQLPDVPKPKMPRMQFWPEKSEVDAARNAWVVENPDTMPPSPLQALSDGARRVGDSTRSAWGKTVDVLTPGEPPSDSSRVARREPRSPWWKRMFGAEEQPQGPQTVTEWMAQERLDP